MKASIRDPDELRLLEPESIQAYLRFRGWLSEDAGHPRAKLWYIDIGRDSFEALLPSTQVVRDYVLRVSELLRTLERVEQRSQLDIVRDITLVTSDVVRVRLPTNHRGDGIPLPDGVRLVEHAMSMMAAAAASAVTPKKVLPSRRPAQAQDYLDHVRMGQTERGSFILTIVSDVRPLLTPGAPGLLEYMDEPFPRRVTRTLVHALAAAYDASILARRSGEFTAFERGVELGVSANMCEAISGMVEAAQDQKGVSLEVDWAPSSPVDEQGPAPLEFTHEDREILTEAARKLRENSPYEGLPITGVVTSLRREEASENGSAVVSCVIEGTLRRLVVPLSPEEYEVAIDAHREKRGIFFKADVAQAGRQYHATNIQSLRLTE